MNLDFGERKKQHNLFVFKLYLQFLFPYVLRLWLRIGWKHGGAPAEPLCSPQWCAGRSSFPLPFVVGLEFPQQPIFFGHPTLLLRARVKLQL